MARFTLTGKRGGDAAVSVTWSDGLLSGDRDAVAAVRQLAVAYEGRTIGQAGGPYTTRGHLRSPYTARYLMQMVFSERPTLTAGKVPSIDAPPPGAIR